MDDFLISPATGLSLILAILHGALFHLWRGRTWVDLGLSLLMALVGVGLGQVGGQLLGLNLLRIGEVYLLEGAICAWLLMLAAAWLKG